MDDMQKFWDNMKTPDWRVVYGEIDFSRFTFEQQVALKNGRDRGLPYQMYANKDWSVSEMEHYREILAKTAYADWQHGKRPSDVVKAAYEHEAKTPGFKNRFNFENHSDLVCYVPENWDEFVDGKAWTRQDFLLLCGNDTEKASRVFDSCEWQSPETVLDELEREEAEEMDTPVPEEKAGITGSDSIRPELISAIAERLEEIYKAQNDPQVLHPTTAEIKLYNFLSGVTAASGIGTCYEKDMVTLIDNEHSEYGEPIMSIDRHGIVGREDVEKFIFDDNLTVPDKACCLVEGYLWATEPLVTRMKEHAVLTPEQKDSMDNINFYALYDPTTKEIRVDSTYYLLGSGEGSPEVQHEFTLDLSPDERKDLISKMETYCQKKNGADLETFVNSIRQSEGLPPLGKPGLSSIIQNAENRKEQIPPTGMSHARSESIRT